MTDSEQKTIFARNLNKYIAKTGKQQAEVAKELGINATTLNMWCRGNSMPSTGKIRTLADYFRIGMTDLTDDKPEEQVIEQFTDAAVNIFLHDSHFADIVLRYKDLSDKQRKILCDFLEVFVFAKDEPG